MQVSSDSNKVYVNWGDAESKFHNIWLRDLCQCKDHFHPGTRQRLQNTFEVSSFILQPIVGGSALPMTPGSAYAEYHADRC